MDRALALRSLAAVAVVGNVLFNGMYERLGLTDMATISAEHQTPFTPAGFTFAIWGVIYATWLALAAALLLLPSWRRAPLLTRLVPPFVGLNALCSIWIAVFSLRAFGSALIIIALHLGVALLFRVRARQTPLLPRLAASLIVAWLTVAAVANAIVVLHALAPELAAARVTTVAALLLVAAALVALSLWLDDDRVIPLVGIWALIGIRAETSDASIAGLATLLAFVLALFTLSRALGPQRGRPAPTWPKKPPRAVRGPR